MRKRKLKLTPNKRNGNEYNQRLQRQKNIRELEIYIGGSQ
jgi:hypothetical protein